MAWGEKMRRLFRDRRGSSSRRNPSLRPLLPEGDSSSFEEQDLPEPRLPIEQSSGNSDQVDKEEDWFEPEVHAEDPSGKSDLVVVESSGNSNQHVDEPPKSRAAGNDYGHPIKLTCVADPEVIAQMVKLPVSGGVSKGPSPEFDLSPPHAGAPSIDINFSPPGAGGSQYTEFNLSPPDGGGPCRELPPHNLSPPRADDGGQCTESPVADGGGPCRVFNLSPASPKSPQEFLEMSRQVFLETSLKYHFSRLGSNGPSKEFNPSLPLGPRQLEASSSGSGGVRLPEGISSHLIKDGSMVPTDDQDRPAPTKTIQVRAAPTDDQVRAAPTDEPDRTAPNKTIQLLAAPTDDQDLRKGTHDINARGVAGDSDFDYHPLSYTWGIHNTNLFFMAVGLLVLVMMIRSTEPPTDADAIWKNSLNLGYGFIILTLCLSQTSGSALALVLAISYGPFIAWAVHSHSGPIFGRAAIHLTTAWAAGCFGYSIAIYRLSVGSLQVDRVAHIEWYSRRSKEQNGILDVYCCLMVTILTLFLVVPVIWIIKNMMWMKANDFVLALTFLTMITTVLLYAWSIPLVFKTAIVSVDTMIRLMVVFLASFAPSFVVAIFGRVLLLYYFSILMMMMAVMFGYVLAANQHRKCSASLVLLEAKDNNGEARTHGPETVFTHQRK